MRVKSEIIPVTREIRNYLSGSVNSCNDLYEYEKALFKYYDIALKNNKSDIWVYQELVLDGFGEYVDRDSDMYQEALMAYIDVINIANSDKKDCLDFFEEFCILEGNLYKEMLREEQFSRIRRR